MKRLFTMLLWLICAGSFGTAIDSLETALKTAEGDVKVKIMNELFRAYINSDPVKAIGFSREALTLATSINDQKGMAASYNNLGVAYKNQGALEIALSNYLHALDLYSQIQNADGIATAKNNIATIYSMKRDYSQALKYFEESHLQFVALGDREKIIGSMNNLGNLNSDMQLFDQALKYFDEARKLGDESGKKYADPLSNLGNLYVRQKNYQRAVEYYLRALEIVRDQGDRLSELSLIANLGSTYALAGQPRPAEQYLSQALAMSKELQAAIYLPQILKSQASNFARQGKMKDAYETMLKYNEVREEIYGEESSRKIAQMDMALSLHEKEKEIEALQLDDQMKTLKLRNTQFVVTSFVLALVAVIAVFNIFFVSKRARKV